MKLRKIPLESLIEILQDLYESGADYIDISGKNDEKNRDIIHITIKEEYMFYNEEEDDDATERSIFEGDINDLI
jgi:hypothetical protein